MTKNIALLFLTVLSAVQGVEVATGQPQVPNANQNPLLFPILGYPVGMELKVWYDGNREPTRDTWKTASIDLFCPFEEVVTSNLLLGNKNLILGRFEYRTAWPNRPSSTLTFTGQQKPVFDAHNRIPFCLKPIGERDTLLKRLLNKFNNKMISFWWDSTTPLTGEPVLQNPIAEMAVGGMNPARFVAGTEVRINVAYHQINNPAEGIWQAAGNLPVRVGNNPQAHVMTVFFDIEDISIFPRSLYDAITKNLRVEMGYTVGMLRGMPSDTTRNIMDFAGVSGPIIDFDCKYAPGLLPLHIGPLTIPTSMMYTHITQDKCKIILPREFGRSIDDSLFIGMDILRKFYFSVDYHPQDGDTLQFAARREGQAPQRP